MDTRTWRLLALFGGGLAVLVFALWRFGGEKPPASASAAIDASTQANLGVKRLDSDSARLIEQSERPVAPPMPEMPAIRPEDVPVPQPEPRDEPPPVSPPIEPSETDLAMSEEVLAAQEQAREQVEEALAGQRTAIRNACWKGGTADPVSVPIETTFAADGAMLALRIGDVRGQPGVAACVRLQPLAFKVDPPGVGVTVQSKLTLP